jgi:4-alpha-glucanotransferase
MQFERAGGILLHPTSLPSAYGIGDLGGATQSWLDWLSSAGCSLWQVLPLGPTGYGDSPYQNFSAFAGNPLLIGLDGLIEEGLLKAVDISPIPDFPQERVDYGLAIAYHERLLTLASQRFRNGSAQHLTDAYRAFCREQAGWLDDFALFMALKNKHHGRPWIEWDPATANREPEALQAASTTLEPSIEDHRFRQFIFFQQWGRITRQAHDLGISIIGDIPIFVSHDSADVWARPELFHLDDAGMPTVVAGVPPDYFSPTGQRWGNPLYRWDLMRENGYDWWIKRFKAVLSCVDTVRLDHFRGFEAYWEVPADSPTAEIGRWVRGPGDGFLTIVRAALDDLPIIAEDLGLITPEVEALRDRFDLPGMKVLQFGFEGSMDHPFLPHNYPEHCVAYTGTHDNDTARGWYDAAGEAHRAFCRQYLSSDGSQIAMDMIRALWSSVATWVIAPLQDFLELGSEARMNYPGLPSGNWSWRYRSGELTEELADRVRTMNETSNRVRSLMDTRDGSGGVVGRREGG